LTSLFAGALPAVVCTRVNIAYRAPPHSPFAFSLTAFSSFAPEAELWGLHLKTLFKVEHACHVVESLRHSLCLGGTAPPLPAELPVTIADVAPGYSGIVWASDGAPVSVLPVPRGGPPVRVAPHSFAWTRVGGATGAVASPASCSSASSSSSSDPADLIHHFKPNLNAERLGLTIEDYKHFQAMLPLELRLRQRKRLLLIHHLKVVSSQGGDPVALVKQLFPDGAACCKLDEVPSDSGAGRAASTASTGRKRV
jgi:hypothetical protein